ncbi:insulin-like peptide receptor isoform X2 [Homalodisca vitripennis]|uniref:insulin-like peptide receptor isoform X2 n=1 Tax=Homalodisca vitripennis TaxID=197043 RepID=UPI001EECA835|nr:insulin-like peptide receptor isoform X2 [Homalodisca vitripennis]
MCFPIKRSDCARPRTRTTCYGSGDDVSWLCTALLALALLTTSAAAQNATDTVPFNRTGVCRSLDIRNSVEQFNQLEGCQVIEGFLQIVLIDRADPNEYDNLTFPELREVTGYILLYRVHGLRSLAKLFPNLSVIRGNELFSDYALVVFEMLHLQELGLSSLTDILRGGVYFVKNPMLCYIDTIDWDLIAKQSQSSDLEGKKGQMHFIRNNKRENECPICPRDCPLMVGSQDNHLCWSPQHCQKVCPESCGNRACDATGACCHDNCLGGCHVNNATNCFSCRGVLQDGHCMSSCPKDSFKYLNRRCISEEECYALPKPRLVIQTNSANQQDGNLIPDHPWKPFNGECILTCPAGYLETNNSNRYNCKLCQVDKCQKECTGGNVDSIANAQRLRDCTYIKGSLEIQIRGGINVVKELEENLNKIEEISGYLKIVRSFPIMSLNFLKKLRIIHGNDLESGKYSLVVLDNQNLVELWDWENKGKDFQIKRGRLFFHFNPKLCIDKITELKELAHLPDFTDLEVAQNSNGDKVACNVKELEVKVYKSGPKAVLIKWRPFTHYDSRTLLGYVIYTIEAPYQNVTMYDGRDACGGDGWRVDDIAIPEPSEKEVDWMDAILTLLEPYTQYAFYIKTYTIATEKVGAQSKIKYFRTHPDTPSVPRALKVYSNSSSELIINWSPPRVPNGNVTHYIVRGQWERDDQKFLDQRNYCKEPLSLPDNKHSQTKVDEDGTDLDPDGLGLSNIYTKKDCVCKKDDKEERGKKQREKEIQFQIQFEDALHNQVYVKRKNAPDDLNTVPTELDKKRPQRDKREIKFRNDIVNNEYPRVEKTSLGNIGEPKNKLPRNDEETFEHEVWGGNSLVVHKLHHFAHYTISVTACREVLDEETDIGKKNNCSAQAIFSTRTQPLNTADTVPYLNVEVMDSSNHSGDVLLKWEEPKSPNGLIVTYQIEYTRSDIENYKPQIVCITRRKFHNLSKSYILKDLSPGNYSVKVRATSLAGNGNYTESVNFYIQERQSITMLQMLIITIAIVILLVGLVFLALVYHRKQMAQEVANSRLIASVNPEYVSTMYVADQWEVPREQIELVKELGQGSFGMVWRGIAYNIVPGHEKMDCAVKTVNETASDRERIEFLNEASVMKGFNTHHVVQLLGVVSKGQPTLVVMELMANGDLKSYLRSHRPDAVDDPTKQPPTLREILQMAIEIADGMAYLAAKKFVHRDLAARNCMVAEDLTVKIGDFGMTRDIYETDYYRKGTKGLLPVRWMAPESLKDGVFTSSSDVWSYGVVLWEMATLASQPYQGLTNDQTLKYVIEGRVMLPPDNCPENLYWLMKRCWQYKPLMRPTFLELVTDLLPEANQKFSTVSFYHSEEGQEIRGGASAGMVAPVPPPTVVGEAVAETTGAGGETTPLCITREIEDFSLGSDDEENYKQSSGSSKVSNGSTTTPNGYILARPNGIKTTKC